MFKMNLFAKLSNNCLKRLIIALMVFPFYVGISYVFADEIGSKKAEALYGQAKKAYYSLINKVKDRPIAREEWNLCIDKFNRV